MEGNLCATKTHTAISSLCITSTIIDASTSQYVVMTNLTSGTQMENLQDEPEMSFVFLSVVTGIMIMGLGGTFWAWRKDARGNTKTGITVIPQQSFHRCPQHYLLMFYTGAGRHSGTTANVFCRIQGKQRQTKPIVLRDPDRPMFLPSSVSSFLVTLNRSLDQIREIHVWHDISGPDPPWFLEGVVICHLNTDVTWYFEANRWLDVSTGAGEVECKLQPLRRKEFLGYKTLFDAKLADNLKHNHFWWSSFFSKNKIGLTRFQKMSACLALTGLMIMMATILVKETQNVFSTGSVTLGPWKLQLDDIYRALICSGVAFLLRLLVEYLFLKSERKRTLSDQEKDVYEHIRESFDKLGDIVFLDGDIDESGLNDNENTNHSENSELDMELSELENRENSDKETPDGGHAHASNSHGDNTERTDGELRDFSGRTGGEKNNTLEMGTGDGFDTSQDALDLNGACSDLEGLIGVLGDLPEKEELLQILDKNLNVEVDREDKVLEENNVLAMVESHPKEVSLVDNQDIELELELPTENTTARPKAFSLRRLSQKRRESEDNRPESVSWTKTTTNTDKIPKLWKKLPYPRDLLDDRSIKKQNTAPAVFPHRVLIITNVQCFVVSLISTIVAIAIGFRWPVALTTSWLMTLGIAIATEIFAMETLYLFAHAIYFTVWRRRPMKEEDLINELQNKVWVNEEENCTYFADDVDEGDSDSVPRPPGPADIQKAREKAGKDRELEDVIKMLAFDVVFLCLLVYICFGNRDSSSHPVRVNLENHLNVSDGFNEIKNTKMFWSWLEQYTIPTLFDGVKRRTSKEKNRFLIDGYSYLLGTAILRQQRLRPGEPCTIPEEARHLFAGCNPESLTEHNEDTDPYSYGWKKGRGTRTNISLPSPWIYSGDIESKTAYSMWARRNTFHGGGYIAYLGSEKDTAVQLINSLQAHKWVDTLTRVVFVEFSIYNANMNILGALVFSMEFTAFGGAFPRFDMYSFRLYRYFTTLQFGFLVAEITFVFFVAQLTYRVGCHIYRDRWRYFKSFWNITDILLIIFSLIAIAFYAVRSSYLNNAIEAIREDPDTFYGFLAVAFYDDMIAYISCLIVLIPILQFLKFLKFNKNFMIFYSTLSRIRSDVCVFMFVFFVSLACFTFWAHTMLMTAAEMYANFGGAFGSMIAMLLGKFSFRLFSPGQPVTSAVGPLFTYTFTCTNVFFILNIILTIITIGFKEAREDERFQKSEYEIGKFIINLIKGYFGLLPPYIPPPPQIKPPARGKHFTYFQWKLCTSYVTQSQFPRLMNFANDTYLEDFADELELVANLLSMPQPRRVFEEIYRREHGIL